MEDAGVDGGWAEREEERIRALRDGGKKESE